jgi:DtxR family Mn-dependent transcriptional regulator
VPAKKPAAKKLTRGIEDYLEAIHLLRKNQDIVRVRDIARALGVSMPSVTGMVSKLRKQGLVNHVRYESVSLTPHGEERAAQVYHRHEGIRNFLATILGLENKEAEKQACRMEHAMSEETLSRLTKLIDYVGTCRLGQAHWIEGFHRYLRTGKLRKHDCGL